MREAFGYGLTLLIVHAALAGVVYSIAAPELAVWGAIAAFVSGLLGTTLAGLWLHLWAYLFGIRGLRASLKTAYFGSTPSYLAGWLTVIPGLALLRLALVAWNFVLYGIGLQKIHNVPSRKAWYAALAAFLTGLAAFLGIAYLVVAVYLPYLFSLAY